VTAVLIGVMAVALWLILRPPRGLHRRVRKAFARSAAGSRHDRQRDGGEARGGQDFALAGRSRGWGQGRERRDAAVSLTVLVQQLAALLKGGRTPARLWDELCLVYGGSGPADGAPGGPRLSPGSAAVLAAARGAAMRGSPVAEAVRFAAASSGHPAGSREPRIWQELAACFDIAEASGCPLADVLTRFAAQLEVEDDAEAARQTALAGPKATVTLLTWLPLLGLGLGFCLGVDPLAMLLGTPIGAAALVAGIVLTIAGRLWSARLVRAAAGAAVP
jgi:tight adherence protein B